MSIEYGPDAPSEPGEPGCVASGLTMDSWSDDTASDLGLGSNSDRVKVLHTVASVGDDNTQ